MEQNQQRNMVVLDGEVVDLYPPKSEKAPTVFTVKQTEEFNGNTRTNYISGKTFKHDEVRKGAIVHAIGSLRTNRWEKDGVKHRDLEVIFNKIEETGFNGQAVAGEESQERPMTQVEAIAQTKEEIPDDIPEGEINFDEIPF